MHSKSYSNQTTQALNYEAAASVTMNKSSFPFRQSQSQFSLSGNSIFYDYYAEVIWMGLFINSW